MPDGGTGREEVTGPPETSGLGRDFSTRRHRRFPRLGRGFSGRGFLSRPALIALAVAVPMAEAAAVNLTVPSARALSPEVTALAPLAVFHDLRWLFGLGGTWPRFALTLAAVVAARSLLDAALAWLAWPRGLARPRTMLLLGSSAALTVCAVLLLSPLVALVFGVALLPFSWPFLGMLPVLVLFALLLSHGSAASWWWRTLPPLRAATWLLTEFMVLSAAALVINRLPAGYAVPLAGLAGVVNARAWYGVTAALAGPLSARSPGARSGPPPEPGHPAAADRPGGRGAGHRPGHRGGAGWLRGGDRPAPPGAPRPRPRSAPRTRRRRQRLIRPPPVPPASLRSWRSRGSGRPAAPPRPRCGPSPATRSPSSSPTGA